MIGSVLLFVLGFLAATLLALLLAPAYRRRTVGLTRRRIEATVPLTREEILAEKDRLRAEHAMEIRRIEIAAKALRETNSTQLIELGRAREMLTKTAGDRERQGQSLTDTETRVASLNALIVEGKAWADELERSLGVAESAMKARAAELEALQQQLDEAALTSSNRQVDLMTAETEIGRLKSEVAALKADAERGLHTSDAAVAAAREKRGTEIDALGRQLEEAILVSSGRQIELVAKDTEIDRLNGELSDLRADTARRLGAADEAVAALRADREMSADAPAFPEDGETVPASDDERGRLQERLTLLMRENRRLKDELADYDEAPKVDQANAGDDVLRDRLAAMAAEIVALTAAVEGPGSPIPALLANAPVGAPDAPNLADRIRALQRKAAG